MYDDKRTYVREKIELTTKEMTWGREIITAVRAGSVFERTCSMGWEYAAARAVGDFHS
jgi:hypothetical protein